MVCPIKIVLMSCLYNANFSKKSSVYLKVNPVEQLRFTELKDGSYKYNSDVNLLLNAERIKNTVGEEGYLNILRQISKPVHSPYRDGVNNFSDAELMRTVKPRYVQHLSEIRAWSESLMSEFDSIIQDIQLKKQLEEKLKSGEDKFNEVVEMLKNISGAQSVSSE